MIRISCYIFFWLFSGSSFLKAQDIEVKVVGRFGSPRNYINEQWIQQSYGSYEQNKMLVPNQLINDHRLFSTSDNGILIKLNKPLNKKNGIFGTIGIEYARTGYTKNQYFNDVYFEPLYFHHDRSTLHFGGFKRFNFFNGKLFLDFGVSFQRRIYHRNIQFHEKELQPVTSQYGDLLQYHSSITVYQGYTYNSNGERRINVLNNIHFEFNSSISFKINRELDLSLGFDYNRNHILHYDFFAIGFQSDFPPSGGLETTVYKKDPYAGEDGAKETVRSHFRYFNIGFTYKL